MRNLRLNLFGKFKIQRANGDEIILPSRKGKMLMAYLALCPEQKATRTQLASLLWGDRFDEQARASLRQSLYDLRNLLADEEIEIFASDGDWVIFNSAGLETDIQEFKSLTEAGTIPDLQAALALYDHDFAPDLDLSEPGIGEWFDVYRKQLAENAYAAARRLIDLLCEAELPGEAIDVARQLIIIDPVREEGHRCLMQLYTLTGQRNEALRQYQLCCDIVRAELDVEPEDETTSLYLQIHSNEQMQTDAPNSGKRSPLSATPTRGVPVLRAISRSSRFWIFFAGSGSAIAIAIVIAVAYFFTSSHDLPLPDKPSIAVIPFTNMTGKADREYFSDGVTADVISKLSRVPDIFVIDRNSVFAYKDRQVTTRQISRELGVRYVVLGSIQAINDRVRIDAQLVDATSGQQIWAEQFEREMQDMFALQDDVTLRIVGAIQVETYSHAAKLAFRKDTSNLKAYDYVLRGRQYLFDLTPESNRMARELYEKAVKLDPAYARARAYLSWTYLNEMRMGWSNSAAMSLQKAFENAKQAVALDNFTPGGYEALGDVYLWSGQHEIAMTEIRKALELDPSSASAYAKLGDISIWAGRPDEGIAYLEKAIRLNPHFPYTYVWYRAHGHFVAKRYAKALDELRNLQNLKPDFLPTYLYLGVIHERLGNGEDARRALASAASLQPALTKKITLDAFPYKDPEARQDFVSSLLRITESR